MKQQKKHYECLDGLRSLTALIVIIIHVGCNLGHFTGFAPVDHTIRSLEFFIFLFFIVSSFGLCCGYYDRFYENKIDFDSFYRKRFSKIWPFFAFVVLLDFAISHTLSSGIEAFANLTLVYGLLPNFDLSVIGVGWFLGTIFVFYIIFPFFCVLIKNKKRAWAVFIIAIIYHIISARYFLGEKFVVPSYTHRKNFLYDSMYFIAGGLIFLYRDTLTKIFHGKKTIFLCLISVALYSAFIVSLNYYRCEDVDNICALIILSLWTIFGICTETKLLNNKVMKFISGISLEIYLCHMIVFRILEKAGVTKIFANETVSYLFTIVLVFFGAILFSLGVNKLLGAIGKFMKKLRT